MLKTLSVIIYLISFILIFEEIFRLTYFIYKYNKSFDYGKILQNICKNEYIERETSRFHIALNENDIEISNTEKNKKNYFRLLLIISIFFTCIISLIFSIIIYNIFCNINLKEFNNYKIHHKIYIVIILSICIISLLYPILLIFYNLKELKNRIDISLFDSSGNINRMLPFIYTFIGLIILKLVIIYFKYKVPNFEIADDNNNINELIIFCIYGLVYIAIIYYITNYILLYNYYNDEIIINNNDDDDSNDGIISYYLNKVIGFKEHEKYINKIAAVVKKDNTLKETTNNKKILPTSLNDIDDIPENNKEKIYESIINLNKNLDENKLKYLINNIIILYIKNLYNSQLLKKTDHYKIKELELQLIEKIKIELKEKFPNDNIDYVASIILQKIILEIDNLVKEIKNNNNLEKNINNEKKITYDKKTIFRKNLSGLIFIFIIFLVTLTIIQLILKKFNFEYLHKKIKYYILIPFISLFIFLFIINSTIEYNTLINKYILKSPIEIYKNNLNNINDSFNILLQEEYYKYLNKKYTICKNVRNNIIQVLLSNILYFNLLNNYNDINTIIDWKNIPDINNIKNNSIKCNDNDSDYDEFIFDSCIIRNDCTSTNIFFGRDDDINNCNLLNYKNIKNIIKNLLLFDNINFSDDVEFINIKEKVSETNYELNTGDIFNNVNTGKKLNIKSYEWLNIVKMNNINNNNYYSYYLKLNDNYYRLKDDGIFNKLLREIYIKTNDIDIKNISDYIIYEIINKNNIYNKFKSRIEFVKKNLKNIIYTSLYNSIVLEENSSRTQYIVNEKNINSYIVNDYEDHISLKKYNKIVNNIVNRYIELLIKNIYLLSKLLNADQNIIELGELYNKMIDKPNIIDKNKTNYISVNLKNNIILYINNIVKEITIFFDEINNNFKLKDNNFKNILNNYIINNYNNINENNIYTKDIILPYLQKEENNNIYHKNIENLLKIIELNNTNYNNLRKYVCDKEFTLTNECNLNTYKLDINNIKKVLIENIHNIKKFEDEYSKYKEDDKFINYLIYLKIDTVNYENDNILNILDQIQYNYNKLNADDIGLRIIYNKILKTLKDKNMIDTDNKLNDIKINIKKDLFTNYKIYNENIKYYDIIKNTIDNNNKNNNIIKYNNIDKNISIEINNNINDVNKSLLILLIIYIISIILINYIR
tara:strand:+ start:2742 stop:6245 length:3504 start_codon:yes stop_codon:yes gene_type:complete